MVLSSPSTTQLSLGQLGSVPKQRYHKVYSLDLTGFWAFNGAVVCREQIIKTHYQDTYAPQFAIQHFVSIV